jgi:hypothetical protein
MIVLHGAEVLVPPPARYPDIYPALFAIFGAGHFCLVYTMGLWWQASLSDKSGKKL